MTLLGLSSRKFLGARPQALVSARCIFFDEIVVALFSDQLDDES
jgi:hypothetical protein